MSEEKNVGQFDSILRIILGFTSTGLLIYHFMGNGYLPLYGIVVLLILIPLFLKTGFTKVCPIMKALNISTLPKEKVSS